MFKSNLKQLMSLMEWDHAHITCEQGVVSH